ncbi:MAG TPA: hypothetical protein VGM82_24800 [Gemmatimonadaceae bacterium]|jgi:hypothetical protein
MRPTSAFTFDVALSAVRYDSILVSELTEHLAHRLTGSAIWAGHAAEDGPGAQSALFADVSRLVVVLHQRLWHHDLMTQSDQAALRQRISARPDSVRVVALDDSPIHDGLLGIESCSLVAVGLSDVADFVFRAIQDCGGSLRQLEGTDTDAEVPIRRWGDTPLPYLRQPRSLSSLRRELDALVDAADAHPPAENADGTVLAVEISNVPNRLVARVGNTALSFSWMSDRSGAVAEGRLLVMEWTGAVGDGRGSLRNATMTRERTYRAESSGPENWRWRADEPHGRAHSTADLVGEWFAGASLRQLPVIQREPELARRAV